MDSINSIPTERKISTEEKVKPMAMQFVEDCRAKGLTLGEFHVLSQLISCECEKIKKEAEKKILLNEAI